ncbi:hypothetical protein JW851_00640 [Candidatus Woesearchaeota archaeon]|nr:hypothetical protein [Candidatus Woesearchaeota archaeon]
MSKNYQKDYKPQGEQYFKDGLKRIIDKMRSIQTVNVSLRSEECLDTMITMRCDFLKLGLDLIEEMNSCGTDSDNAEMKKNLLDLWDYYQRIHKLEETINWYYSDFVELERSQILKGLNSRIT